jgi:hypothetical protein
MPAAARWCGFRRVMSRPFHSSFLARAGNADEVWINDRLTMNHRREATRSNIVDHVEMLYNSTRRYSFSQDTLPLSLRSGHSSGSLVSLEAPWRFEFLVYNSLA